MEKTLEEIASELGISRQAAHQCLRRALTKAEKICEARGLSREEALEIFKSSDNRETVWEKIERN